MIVQKTLAHMFTGLVGLQGKFCESRAIKHMNFVACQLLRD